MTLRARYRLWFLATRPAFLSVTVIAVLLGLSTARFDGYTPAFWLASLTLLFALIAHAGANVINDYYDDVNGGDAANEARIFPFTGGSRFIQQGILTPQQTARLGYTLLLMVIPAGIYLLTQSGPGLWLIGGCGLFCGWAYSATPLALQSRSLGELAITLAWSMIVIGSDYVQRKNFALLPLLAGLSYALLVANLLFNNQIPDLKADAQCGKRTLIVRFGIRIVFTGSLFFYGLAALMVLLGIFTGLFPTLSAIALLSGLPATHALHKLHQNMTDRRTLTRVIHMNIISTILFGTLLSLAFLLG